ncbi:MAG: sulfite exporter TauE/SafE family protein [Nitrospirae bacterium]|nr:sulfite exporter TauE/SafE family protein [Nitrospirota bacterium]MCL5422995.1 sulfite exporter TauE/SafE family protein [Nitrospirota bacterium]
MTFLIGFLAGIFGGLLGIGGGIVMIPLMVGFLKVTQHKAHGTSLAVMVFVGLVGAATYALQGSVDVLASALLAATAIATAHAGARHASSLAEWKLKRSFGAFLVIVSGFLFLKPFLPRLVYFAGGWSKVVVLLLAGSVTGFLSGMMGVGGAVVMIPVMVLLVGMDQHTAQGSSLLTMVPAGLAGALTHMRYGNVQPSLLKGLIPGAFIGTYLGGSVAHFLPEGILRSVFGLMLLWTAFRYLRVPARQEVPQSDAT